MFKKITLFYIVALIGAGIMAALQPHLGIDTNIVELAQLGPTFGVLVLLAAYGSKRVPLKIDLKWHPETPRNIGLAIGLPALAFGMTLLMYKLAGQPISFISPAHVAPAPYVVVLVLAVIGAACEEFGWRSWLQPFLETKYSVLLSSIIVGVMWAFWHVGAFGSGLVFVTLFTIMATGISVVLGRLLKGSRRNNLLVAAVLHASVNTYLLLFFDEEKGNHFAIGAIALSWVVLAVVATTAPRLLGMAKSRG